MAIIAAALLHGVIRVFSRTVLLHNARRIEYRIREELYTQLLSLDLNYFNKERTGDLLSRFANDAYVINVFAQIGLVMLIGLAAKNAILIVEFAKMELEAGKPLMESAMASARLRFRPILMTAFAFILGVVPLLTATGAGSQARIVMGMAVFSGMLVATILGVLSIPALFVMIENFGRKKHVATEEIKAAEGR